MKSIRHTITTGILLLLLAGVGSAESFQGIVAFQVQQGRDSLDMTYHVKGDHLRIEMSGGPGMQGAAMLLDLEGKQMRVLNPEERYYMSIDISRLLDRAEELSKDEDENADMRIERTGETEKILDFLCEKVLIRDGAEVTELWLTDELGPFLSFMSAMRADQREGSLWERFLAGRNAFPLRIVQQDRRGRNRFRMEATSVQPKELPDDLFTIPEGYRELRLPF